MRATDVDCVTGAEGSVRVRRVRYEGGWVSVEQGRQWEDETGRHILIMVGGASVWELRLSRNTLRWTLHETGGGGSRLA